MKNTWKWLISGLVFGLGAMAFAAPTAALFVQNRAGAPLEGQIDAFGDMLAARLSDAGFGVIRAQDVLSRFAESRDAADAQLIRQAVEVLQSVKSEGTVDEPTEAASALRLSQLMNAELLVMASLISVGDNRVRVNSYGMDQESTVKVLRMGLRILDGATGAQLYGDAVAVTDRVMQGGNIQVQAGDQLNDLLDRGAADLAMRVASSTDRIQSERTPADSSLARVQVQTSTDGATVEVDGVAVGSTPGAFQLRPGVHRMRISKEGYATWERSVNVSDGQVLQVAMDLSAHGLARKGELEAQERLDDIAREQSTATAAMKGGVASMASNSYIRLEGMPEVLSVGGDPSSSAPEVINVIQHDGN
ncbi:MAG: PEGA domain-containing protein [Verrucomicrobiota bacterium]|jgi:hypothetical protein|nr:PEGA domain-containing protein [Verrucomicrobiota bacterium]